MINAKTNLYGLIGQPTEHSLSPYIHNFFADYMGLNTAYAAFSVSPEALASAVKGAYDLGIMGLNVTTPYKQAIIPLLLGLDEQAERLGAVNTLKRSECCPGGYVGHNTDITGVTRTLEKHGIVTLSGKRVVIIGAGGSAAAAAFAAAGLDASEIIIANRTQPNANKLAERVKRYYNSIDIKSKSIEYLNANCKADLVIQASAAGFSETEGQSPVIDKAFFANAEFALDFIYSPFQTEFLKQASAAGCTCFNGIDILIYQAAAAYEIWTGAKIPFECTEAINRGVRLKNE